MTGSRAGGSGHGRARIVRLDGVGEDATPAPVARLGARHRPDPERPDPERPAPADLAELDARAEPPDDRGAGATAPIASFEVGRTVTRESGPVADLTGGRSSAPAGRSRRTEPGRGRARADSDGGPDAPTEFAEAAAPAAPDRGRPRAGRRPPGQIDPDADPVAVAREICLALLTDRARTRQELAQALQRKGVPDDAASTVLERFDEVGLIDDAAFAGQWVRSRHRFRGLARRAIAVELRRKGVDDEVAGEALAEVDTESEERRARELVDRRLRSLTVDTTEQRASAARRLVGMLARKGYGGGIAYRVVREALAAHGADPDELGAEPADD